MNKASAAAAKLLQSSLSPRQQPTSLARPWDSPGKKTGMGCNFLLQCVKVKNESEVTQSCLICSNPMDCSPPGSSIHGIFQARVYRRTVQKELHIRDNHDGGITHLEPDILEFEVKLSYGVAQSQTRLK